MSYNELCSGGSYPRLAVATKNTTKYICSRNISEKFKFLRKENLCLVASHLLLTCVITSLLIYF